jgi:uncharacterized membrane protein
MLDYLLMFILTFIVFFVIDLLWLGIFAKKMYDKYLGYLFADKFNFIAAIIFYVLFIIGLVYFAVAPAVAAESLSTGMLNGAIYGFMCYATYDLTNLATVKNWPLKITIIDLIWGTSVGTVSTILGYLLFSLF